MVLLVAALAFLGPIVLAVWTILAELRAKSHKGAQTAREVLTDQERATLSKYEGRLEAIRREYGRLDRKGDMAGLARRQDGRFDARNVAARQLNAELGDLEARHAALQAEYDGVSNSLATRMEKWLNARARVVGSRAALLTFAIAFTVIVAANGASLAPGALLFGTGQDGGVRTWASACAVVVAAIVYWTTASATKKSLVA
ncbi:hypothetical protein [Phenylobacterium sp.]|uniref:hypothetical protein n=1 Tax=Phenylobacterium sp. TaxID=1871053 RepID=UPI002614948D|nr:hypothetical protein [Phenylobacterium sp.]